MRGIFLTLVLLCLGIYNANADVKLPSVFASNMVLQQQSEVPIWGWADKKEQVTINASWLTEDIQVKADTDGKWRAKISTPSYGGPYTIEFNASNKIILNNVLIGEVWVCSGQSNMEMPVKGFNSQPVYGSNDLIAHANNANIRLFNIRNDYAAEIKRDCSSQWTEANPQSVANFSAVAYSYARYLNEVLQVPIGVINATWGGTRVEAWMDKEVLETEFKEVFLGDIGTEKMKFQTPTVLYNAMVHPIQGFGIKGVIWYQGESNSAQPKQYEELFPRMITRWRELWGQGDFPFYYVQICPFQNYGKTPGRNTAELREAQLKAMSKVVNTGMVSTVDIGHRWNIHPPEKITIGHRLAYWALNKDYGFNQVICGGPVYNSMNVKDGKAYLNFKNAPLGIDNKGKHLSDFYIAGTDSVFHPAKALIKGIQLEVWNDEVKEPVAIRYGWSNWFVGSLYNTAGNPASSFRTDNWDDIK
ncbi:sialate O-acetylesterase [Labilibacter marinus]|uniref:sialate O-acetylesterase n=1 Tax=Labilibacter marinus TaxID=1477105 RepID=UPI000837260B|nr:sialate O-acetylesterase [Labilibacter marinus]